MVGDWKCDRSVTKEPEHQLLSMNDDGYYREITLHAPKQSLSINNNNSAFGALLFFRHIIISQTTTLALSLQC